jgi:sugar lactone lactonase YvrE
MANQYRANLVRSAAAFTLLTTIVFSGACSLNQKAMVLMVQPSYRAEIVATSRDGITVGDGILWRQGRFYIADEGGSAIRLWSGTGQAVTVGNGKGVKSPEDLVVDAGGNIYFTDDDAGGVWRINNFGETRRLAGPDEGLVSTEGLALTPGGDLIVGEGLSHKIFLVQSEGHVSEFLGTDAGISKAETMSFDDGGNLFIGDNEDDVLYLLTADKKLHRMIEGREDFSPESLCYSHGILYITDSKHGKLFTYTPEDGLDVLAVFGGELHPVNGVTTDDKGSVYVSVQTDLKKKIGYILKIDRDQK